MKKKAHQKQKNNHENPIAIGSLIGLYLALIQTLAGLPVLALIHILSGNMATLIVVGLFLIYTLKATLLISAYILARKLFAKYQLELNKYAAISFSVIIFTLSETARIVKINWIPYLSDFVYLPIFGALSAFAIFALHHKLREERLVKNATILITISCACIYWLSYYF